MIAGNTAKFAGGLEPNRRYADFALPDAETLSGEEIAKRVIERAGLKVEGGETS